MRRWVRVGAAVLAAAVLAGCTGASEKRSASSLDPRGGSSTTPPTGVEADRRKALRLVATTVFLPAYRQLAGAARELESATAACDLERSRTALRGARLAYDRAYAGNGFSPMDLRRMLTTIDFWPTDAPKIEALLAGTDPLTVEAVEAQGARLRGLPGIAVVLAAAGPLAGRRCQLAGAASTLVRRDAEAVAARWEELAPTLEGSPTDVGSFVTSLVTTVALVEGVQLGIPAGLRKGIPAGVQNVRGSMALEDSAATLAGALTAIDVGLRPLVSAELGDRMRQAGQASQAAIATIPGPLEKAVFSSVPSIQAAQTAIRVLEALLTTEVVGSLGLTLRFPADGD